MPLVYGCKEKFLPEVKEVNVSYLVVEGLINTGADSTIFNISRTFKLNNKAVVAPEKAALVQVENEGGTTYVLPETIKSGKYGRPSLNLDPAKKYRLRIRTKDNKEYLSDFVESKTAQPFDLKYIITNNALNIYISTLDPAGKSIYYRHSYEETWQYESPIKSFYKFENGKLVSRNFPEDDITNCWHFLPSSNISLSSTANLTEDRLTDKLIVSIPSNSEKVKVGYSILIKQSALTKDAFEFWEILRNNTENVGSIFDPQPSQFLSNIRSTTNAAEIVIGFVSSGSTTQKRFIIKVADLPTAWFNYSPDEDCNNSRKGLSEFKGVPFIPITVTNGTDLLYCVDCRLRGGTTQKPSFW